MHIELHLWKLMMQRKFIFLKKKQKTKQNTHTHVWLEDGIKDDFFEQGCRRLEWEEVEMLSMQLGNVAAFAAFY